MNSAAKATAKGSIAGTIIRADGKREEIGTLGHSLFAKALASLRSFLRRGSQ
jgi:hypothetical protein